MASSSLAALALGYLLGSYSVFVSGFEWALLSTSHTGSAPIHRPDAGFALSYQWPLNLTSMGYLALGGTLFLVMGVTAFNLAEKLTKCLADIASPDDLVRLNSACSAGFISSKGGVDGSGRSEQTLQDVRD